jgi:hypothetical protein
LALGFQSCIAVLAGGLKTMPLGVNSIMQKHFILIAIISISLLTSCLIERPADWWFLEPLNYRDSTSFHDEVIISSVYIDEENSFCFILNCIESNVDTFHYEILYTLKNTSKENIIFRIPQIELYTNAFLLKPNLFYDASIDANSSVQHRIKFLFKEKNKRYDEKLSENESKIVVTNLLVERGTKKINIPEYYFK